MDKTIFNTVSYSDAFARLKTDIERREVDLSRRHIVFVPDNFTLFTERLLFSGGGAFDVSVCSFNRLFSQVVKVDNYLPRHGAVMLLKQVIGQNKDRLKFFSKSAQFKGFAERMYDTVSILAKCAVSPQTLNDSGEKGGKVEDIRLIYEEYLKAADGRFVDACGRLKLLTEAVKTADFSDATVYFLGFESLSVAESALVDVLSARAEKCYMYNTGVCDPDFSGIEVEMFSCADITDRLKAVAKRIRHFVKTDNAQYGSMGLLLPSQLNAKALRIMSEFGIPLYLDEKMNIGQTRLAAYLDGLFKLSGGWYDSDDAIRFSKNCFLSVDKRSADIFENYCLKYCVDNAKKFSSTFKTAADKLRDAKNDAEKNKKPIRERTLLNLNADIENEKIAEGVRKQIMSAVNKFKRYIADEYKEGDFSALIEFALKGCRAEELSEEIAKATGVDVTSVPEKILSCAKVLDSICRGGYKIEQLYDLLLEGLAALNVSTIPKNRNAVAAGSASGFRAGGCKYLFVVDFSDGVTPEYASDCALITDSDIDRLDGAGIKISPKISELNERNISNFFFAATEPDYLFLGYSNEGDKRISSASVAVKRTATRLTMTSLELENALLYDDTATLNEEEKTQICRACSVRSNALEMLLKSHGEKKEGGNGLSFASELTEAVGADCAERFLVCGSGEGVTRLESDGLFFKENTTSVTNIQDYFMCPQYNFLKNGLKVTERENGKLSALDVGTFLHKAIEEFVQNFTLVEPAVQMTLIVDRLIEKEFTSLYEANKAVIERAKIDAVTIASNLADQITHSKFEPIWFEKWFGSDENEGGENCSADETDGGTVCTADETDGAVTKADLKNYKLKTIAFDSGKRKIRLRGSIDRADFWDNRVRIIDYKTGKPSSADFDFDDAYYGRKIQLLLYMQVLIKNGFSAGGLFYFPCQTSWGDDSFSFRLSGLCNASDDVIVAMDSCLATPGTKSKIVNVRYNKTPNKETKRLEYKGGCLFSESQIERLCEYAFIVAERAVQEMESGYVEATPHDKSCSYCTYKQACPVSDSNKRVRLKSAKKAEKILSCFDTAVKTDGDSAENGGADCDNANGENSADGENGGGDGNV